MFRKTVIVLALFAVLLGACRGAAPAAQEDPTLKMAMLPILDALPMYVAEAQGYFKDARIKVEFVPVASAAERDQIMQAGQADGMINDLISTVFYNKDGQKIEVVRFARNASPADAQYSILAAKDSSITKPADLKGVEIWHLAGHGDRIYDPALAGKRRAASRRHQDDQCAQDSRSAAAAGRWRKCMRWNWPKPGRGRSVGRLLARLRR